MDQPVPLSVAWGLVRPPSVLERVCRNVAVVGWAVAHLMERARLRPAVERVNRALEARPPVTREVWGQDPARGELAFFLCRTIASEVGWANERFLPDDPMAILCHAAGGRRDAGVAMTIGDRLCRRLAPEEWAWMGRLTLGQAVDFLLPQAPRLCPTCDYNLTANATGVCPECGAAVTWRG
jgi:hypothetical protein